MGSSSALSNRNGSGKINATGGEGMAPYTAGSGVGVQYAGTVTGAGIGTGGRTLFTTHRIAGAPSATVIEGGIITARGGNGTSATGAGIGGGAQYGGTTGNTLGTLRIAGNDTRVYGASGQSSRTQRAGINVVSEIGIGAGIGGGGQFNRGNYFQNSGLTVTLEGGSVVAQSIAVNAAQRAGQGVGGGGWGYSSTGHTDVSTNVGNFTWRQGTIKITGGSLYATGGKFSSVSGIPLYQPSPNEVVENSVPVPYFTSTPVYATINSGNNALANMLYPVWVPANLDDGGSSKPTAGGFLTRTSPAPTYASTPLVSYDNLAEFPSRSVWVLPSTADLTKFSGVIWTTASTGAGINQPNYQISNLTQQKMANVVNNLPTFTQAKTTDKNILRSDYDCGYVVSGVRGTDWTCASGILTVLKSITIRDDPAWSSMGGAIGYGANGAQNAQDHSIVIGAAAAITLTLTGDATAIPVTNNLPGVNIGVNAYNLTVNTAGFKLTTTGAPTTGATPSWPGIRVLLGATLNITGTGEISATGGTTAGNAPTGAGIGERGEITTSTNYMLRAGTINISDAVVFATGGASGLSYPTGAGIGAGGHVKPTAQAATAVDTTGIVTINSGNVFATGGKVGGSVQRVGSGAGIGGGGTINAGGVTTGNWWPINGCTVTINGGTVSAIGGESTANSHQGFGIGLGGWHGASTTYGDTSAVNSFSAKQGTLTINGGSIYTKGQKGTASGNNFSVLASDIADMSPSVPIKNTITNRAPKNTAGVEVFLNEIRLMDGQSGSTATSSTVSLTNASKFVYLNAAGVSTDTYGTTGTKSQLIDGQVSSLVAPGPLNGPQQFNFWTPANSTLGTVSVPGTLTCSIALNTFWSGYIKTSGLDVSLNSAKFYQGYNIHFDNSEDLNAVMPADLWGCDASITLDKANYKPTGYSNNTFAYWQASGFHANQPTGAAGKFLIGSSIAMNTMTSNSILTAKYGPLCGYIVAGGDKSKATCNVGFVMSFDADADINYTIKNSGTTTNWPGTYATAVATNAGVAPTNVDDHSLRIDKTGDLGLKLSGTTTAKPLTSMVPGVNLAAINADLTIDTQTWTLDATGNSSGTTDSSFAGIRVPEDSSLTLEGNSSSGIINAGSKPSTGQLLSAAAGIGGNFSESAGNITINSGTVNAQGTSSSGTVHGAAAGIGGGGTWNNPDAFIAGSVQSVSINGGTVNAKGSTAATTYLVGSASGIGGGGAGCGATAANGCVGIKAAGSLASYTQTGGTVVAQASPCTSACRGGGAGVGGGGAGGFSQAAGGGFIAGDLGDFSLSGGTLIAQSISAVAASQAGAGIGGGSIGISEYKNTGNNRGGSITGSFDISGGTISAVSSGVLGSAVGIGAGSAWTSATVGVSNLNTAQPTLGGTVANGIKILGGSVYTSGSNGTALNTLVTPSIFPQPVGQDGSTSVYLNPIALYNDNTNVTAPGQSVAHATATPRTATLKLRDVGGLQAFTDRELRNAVANTYGTNQMRSQQAAGANVGGVDGVNGAASGSVAQAIYPWLPVGQTGTTLYSDNWTACNAAGTNAGTQYSQYFETANTNQTTAKPAFPGYAMHFVSTPLGADDIPGDTFGNLYGCSASTGTTEPSFPAGSAFEDYEFIEYWSDRSTYNTSTTINLTNATQGPIATANQFIQAFLAFSMCGYVISSPDATDVSYFNGLRCDTTNNNHILVFENSITTAKSYLVKDEVSTWYNNAALNGGVTAANAKDHGIRIDSTANIVFNDSQMTAQPITAPAPGIELAGGTDVTIIVAGGKVVDAIGSGAMPGIRTVSGATLTIKGNGTTKGSSSTYGIGIGSNTRDATIKIGPQSATDTDSPIVVSDHDLVGDIIITGGFADIGEEVRGDVIAVGGNIKAKAIAGQAGEVIQIAGGSIYAPGGISPQPVGVDFSTPVYLNKIKISGTTQTRKLLAVGCGVAGLGTGSLAGFVACQGGVESYRGKTAPVLNEYGTNDMRTQNANGAISSQQASPVAQDQFIYTYLPGTTSNITYGATIYTTDFATLYPALTASSSLQSFISGLADQSTICDASGGNTGSQYTALLNQRGANNSTAATAMPGQMVAYIDDSGTASTTPIGMPAANEYGCADANVAALPSTIGATPRTATTWQETTTSTSYAPLDTVDVAKTRTLNSVTPAPNMPYLLLEPSNFLCGYEVSKTGAPAALLESWSCGKGNVLEYFGAGGSFDIENSASWAASHNATDDMDHAIKINTDSSVVLNVVGDLTATSVS
ncbi:hypothetical protein FACS1894125_5850 [Actinomycetota bacterium]|nr:hypothetical protein FACS1894125_5850 [Actinomycetota bacterium]